MVPLFEEMLATLRRAQAALGQEMEQLTRAGPMDEVNVQRLCEVGRSFQEQAHSLLVMMLYQDAPGELIQETEDLVSFFRDALERLEARRLPDQRAS